MRVSLRTTIAFLRHDIYPARGRKPNIRHKLNLQRTKLRHDIYPARGRKPSSPAHSAPKKLTSPRYLPRKGTETRAMLHELIEILNLRHDIYPARGRKHPFQDPFQVL